MDDDETETANQAEHTSFSPDTRCYHFASQSLFLSKSGPSHFGLAGGDNRIYLVYEQQSKLEIYNYTTRKENLDQSTENDQLAWEGSVGVQQHQPKEEFILERTVLLHDAVDIGQVVYSSLAPEFFVLLVNGGAHSSGRNNSHLLTTYRLRSLKAYTNYMSTSDTMYNIKVRGSGELATAAMLDTTTFSPFQHPEAKSHLPEHLHSIDSCLNVIDFKHADISTLANYVHICPLSGNLLICTANGTTLLYTFTFCRLKLPQLPSSDKDVNDFVAVDFVLAKSITILDGWTPEVVKLSLNYVAFMSSAHFSLLQIVLDDHDQHDSLTAGDSDHNPKNVKIDLKYLKEAESRETHLIYNRLFDEPVPAEMAYLGFPPRQNGCTSTSDHADTVWGPVGYGLACKFAIYNYSMGNTLDGRSTVTSSTYKLLFCRHLPLPPKTPARLRTKEAKSESSSQARQEQAKGMSNELGRIEARNSLVSESSKNYFMFGFELLPYRQRDGSVFAHALYILSAGRQLDCYLVDLRRDHLRLVPISRLLFEHQPFSSSSPSASSAASKLVKTFPSMSSLASTITSVSTIKNSHTLSVISKASTGRVLDFTANPQEDLVHVLLDSGSLDSYATQIFPFLVSDRFENLYCSRPIASMYRISGNLFLNVIAALSSPRFVYLFSGSADAANFSLGERQREGEQEEGEHTIYYLERPSIDHLQADILSALDDLKSNCDEMTMLGGVEFGGRVNDRHSFHRLYLRVLAIIKFALNYPMRSFDGKKMMPLADEDSTQHSQMINKVAKDKFERDDTKSEDFAAMQCLQALYEKVKAEIAEIIADGASCTDSTCPFSGGQYHKEFLYL